MTGVDGDSISLWHTLPAARSVADGAGLVHSGYCFSDELILFVCNVCRGECYAVKLALIRAAEVSPDWANKYFRNNEAITDPISQFTVKANKQGLPRGWTLYRTETALGSLDEHFIGPFIPETNLRGLNGVSRCCTGGDEWEKAAAVIGRVWPLLVPWRSRAWWWLRALRCRVRPCRTCLRCYARMPRQRVFVEPPPQMALEDDDVPF
jgi:hypothetical protein